MSILLVDDQPANLLALEAVLEGLGQHLVKVSSGDEAFLRMQQQDFAVVLLDVQMSGLNGFETARRIRGRTESRHTPIIFVTAYDSDEFPVEQAYELGAVDYLVKPLIPTVLRAKVAGFVELYRLRQANERRARRAMRESEARKAAVIKTALDCVVTMDHKGRILEFNPAAEQTFGYSQRDTLGKQLAELIIPPSFRDRHYRGLARFLATGEGPILGKRIEVTALRADGTEFPVELAVNPTSTEGPPTFTAYLRDITDRRHRERQRQARLLITQTLAEATSLAEAAPRILQVVCESLEWDVGALWELDRSNDLLRCVDVWHQPGLQVAEFEAISRRLQFIPGVGLPGTVWSDGRPKWVPDVTAHENFPRERTAAKEGLHAAFAFPIVLGAEFLGTIEFFSREIREPDPHLLEMMSTVGAQTGQFIDRKRAEDQLRSSEQRFAGFMRHLPGLAWIKDAAGRYVYANGAALDAFRRDQSALYGKTDEEVFPPETAARFKANDQAARASGTGVQVIETLEHEDGVVRHSIVSKFPIVTPDGDPGWVGGMAIDITDRLRAEAEVRRQESQLRLLTDAAPALISYIDAEQRYLIVNHQYEVWFNRSRGEFEGKHLRDVLGDTAYARVQPYVEAVLAGQEVTYEALLPYRDAGLRHVQATYVPHRSEQGTVEGFFALVTDVTQAKRTEAAYRFLAEASAALATVVEHESMLRQVARLAVPFFADWCVVDLVSEDSTLQRLEVVHADPSMSELAAKLRDRYPPMDGDRYGPANVFATGRPEMISRITDEMVSASARDEEHLRVLRELQLRSYISVPLAVRDRVFGVFTFVISESGRTYSEQDLALARDLAQRAAVAIDNARLYRELKQSDRLKDEFLAMLAHELRNPLAPIRNALQIMSIDGVEGDTLAQVREIAARQVTHMARLLDDLLDVSRISRGKIELRKQIVDVATIIDRAVQAANSFIAERNHALTVSLPPEPLQIEADPTRLEQVLVNLLNNAAKYSEPGAQVKLTVDRENNVLVIRVRDTGIGIASDMLPKVFDLFVQADRRMNRSPGGIGIGLTLAKTLIELHGGSVHAFSEGLGKGTEFVVRLPALVEGPGPAAHQDNGDSWGALPARRVLVVDDNRDAADSLTMLLRLAGQEVRAAYDGTTALSLAEIHAPDIIFLDLGMPEMDGFTVAKRIRHLRGLESVCLIALTGWGQSEDRRRTQAAGFDDHLVKPVDPAALAEVLREKFCSPKDRLER